MLVLLIVAVMAALVVPRMFRSSLEQLDDESRRLEQSLRLAVQESSLTGSPIRWSGYPDSYRFEQVDDEGGWQGIDGKVFSNHKLPAYLRIMEVRLEGAEVGRSRLSKKERPALGKIIIYPDGMLTLADIVLMANDTKDAIKILHVRPGPGAILIEDPGE